MKRSKIGEKSPERRKKKKGESNSLVHQLLSQASIIIDSPVEIQKDGVIVRRTLEQVLKRHPEYPQIVSDFIEEFSTLLEDPNILRNFLKPSVAGGEDNQCSGGPCDSLIRLLLSVDLLQPRLICLLLEKLADPSLNEQVGFQGEVLSRVIINQLRWLDKIINPTETVDKIFEVISVADVEVQRDLISCLPELIEDSQHSQVARQLRDLVLENQALHIPILDALTNLNLNYELLTDVRQSIIRILPSTESEGLPVIVQFLLRTCESSDAVQVVNDIRNNLDVSSLVPVASTPRKSRSDLSRSVISLVLDAVKSALRLQKFLADAWIKAMETSQELLVALDLLVILVLNSCGYKKQIEGLVRVKITSGSLTESLIQSTFTSHAQALTEYFSSVLSLAEFLLQVHQPIISSFAAVVFCQAFMAFNSHCKQEIVGNLVTHIGSGSHAAISLSLDILLQLVTSHTQQMAPFAIFIKGVLDYLDNLNLCEIRKLYQMLACLAFSSKQKDSVLQDALHIMIRKQLSNSTTSYQQMGVIGATAVVFSIASRSERKDDSLFPASSAASDTSLSDDSYQQAIQLLQLVRTSSNCSAEVSILYMDELIDAIKLGTVHSRIEDWISENVINDFQEAFVIDITETEADLKGTGPIIPWSIQYGLDSLSDGTIAINVLPLVAAARQKTSNQPANGQTEAPLCNRLESIWCMAPNFRLLQICESRQHNDDLESIDALLGCPLKLPDYIQENLREKINGLSQKEKQIICDCLFVAINWFRETINAFASQKDVEMRCKVVQRLYALNQLQELLPACLTDLVEYTPPPTCGGETGQQKPIVITCMNKKPAASKRKKSTKPKKKKKKQEQESDKESNDEESDDCEDKENKNLDQEDAESHSSTSTSVKCPASLRILRPYLREFDFDVMSLLKIPLEVKFDKVPESGVKDAKKLFIHPAQLNLLLQDLVMKVDQILLAENEITKINPFKKNGSDTGPMFRNLMVLGSETVARSMTSLVSSLCQHIEAISAYFQAMCGTDDGTDLDDSLVSNPSTQNLLMSDCLQQILHVLLKLFSWHGFRQADNKKLLMKALAGLASRLSSGSLSQVTKSDLLMQAYRYIKKLDSSIPRLNVAVTQCNLLACLACKGDMEELKLETKEIALSYLKKEWKDEHGQKEKGSAHNELLQKLLVICFTNSDDSLPIIHEISTQGVTELQDNGQVSSTFATLTKQTYPVFYKSMLSQLIGYVKLLPYSSKSSGEDKEEKLKSWGQAIKIFQALVNLLKTFDGRVNLGAVLKYGRQFVEQFLKSCMPLVDDLFRFNKDEIIVMLKNLQMSTRSLHHICGHSKIMKDVSLTNQVPGMKRCLELFVYRVKVMLTVNNCLEAFWLGNLKNRDLKGEEILSQVTRVEQSDDENSDDDDDENSDNNDENEDDESSNSSAPRGVRKIRPPKRTKAQREALERAQQDDDDDDADDDGSRDNRLSYSETY